MKRLVLFLISATLATHAFAQKGRDHALITDEDQWNLYTKLSPSLCDIGDDTGIWGSLEIGGILNEGLAIGVRATTLLDEAEPGLGSSATVDKFDATYGGVNIEYTFFSSEVFHGSLGCFGGMGQVKFGGRNDGKVDVAVIEPAVNIMLNVTQTSEVGLGLGYRYMDPSGSGSSGLDYGDFSGLDFSIFLRLTEF